MNLPQAEYAKVMRSQLRIAGYNPRGITAEGKEELQRSLINFGVVGGIVINAGNSNTLVGGHQKIAILDEMHGYNGTKGKGDYPVVVSVVNVDTKTEKELNIALNNHRIGGYTDYEKLKNLLPDIDYRNAGLDETDMQMMGIDAKAEELLNTLPDYSDTPKRYNPMGEETEDDPSVDNPSSEKKKGSLIKSAWGQGKEHIEPMCDLVEKISLVRRNDRYYIHSFKTGKEGTPLGECKIKANVDMFAESAATIMREFIGGELSEWSLVCAPKRRHPVWNFGEEVCKAIAAKVGCKFVANMFTVGNKSRLDPAIVRLKPVPKGNVVLYDDILTTGMTMKVMEEHLKGCNLIRIIGISNT